MPEKQVVLCILSASCVVGLGVAAQFRQRRTHLNEMKQLAIKYRLSRLRRTLPDNFPDEFLTGIGSWGLVWDVFLGSSDSDSVLAFETIVSSGRQIYTRTIVARHLAVCEGVPAPISTFTWEDYRGWRMAFLKRKLMDFLCQDECRTH